VSDDWPFDGDVLLADTSIWRRADKLPPDIGAQWERALVNNRIATSPLVEFEVLFRAAQVDLDTFENWRERLGRIRRVLVPDASVWSLAQEAYDELARGGQLAGKSMTDIVVAATARRVPIPVLHVDKDYPALQSLECLDFEARRLNVPSRLSSREGGPQAALPVRRGSQVSVASG
jgi:predicted nucleic acid-binding protein